MHRSATLLSIIALIASAATSAAGDDPAAGPSSPPNIVIIYADDLGYGDLGIYGHHTIKTPHLDQLAREGLRFTNFYAPSPLCSPSRAGLLTGRTPFRTGIRSWIPEGTGVHLSAEETTLATLLKRRGYETFLGGKWHLNAGLGVASQPQPEDHGFDHWLALHAFPIPHNRNPTNFYRNGEPLGEVEGFTAQITVDESIRWLRSRDGAQPFFMYLAMVEPHSTHANPHDFNALYAHLTDGVPKPIVNGLDEPPVELLEARGPGEYYANITYMDAQLGRFLDALDQAGLRDSTLVFFASDNGPVTTVWRNWWEINLYGSTGGLRGRKGDLYEGGIREPAFIRWPGKVAPGTVSDVPLSGYDLLPTLATLVGIEPPSDRPIDGEDFSALLDGGEFERQRPLYWQFDDAAGFHYALRDGDWKLLANESRDRVELYNLATEPFEVLDQSKQRPAKVKELLAKLEQIASSVDSDPLRPDWVQTNREGVAGVAARAPDEALDLWWDQLSALCGQAFAGALSSSDETDADLADQPMTMHMRRCAENRLEIPFHIGENRSRTWVLTRTADGLHLQHDHRHEDGSEDEVTLYGGHTDPANRHGDTEQVQHFPVDQYSIELFEANGLAASVVNVWSMEIVEGKRFSYVLRRPQRHFQADFDLSQPVEAPPAPWGHE